MRRRRQPLLQMNRKAIARHDVEPDAGKQHHVHVLRARALLREHLEDSSENYTRFLLLSPEPTKDALGDKLSLVIELPHQPGALHHSLEPFARRGIDLLKIEGRPVKGRPWEYCFYLDLRGSANDSEVTSALAELRERRVEVRILGSYFSAHVPTISASEPSVEELL